jgi:hypothetical protein
MKPAEDVELLELLFVWLDPLLEGFAEVLVEIYRPEDRYILLEIAPHRQPAPQILLRR